MNSSDESALEAAERQARESRQHADEAKQQREAEGAAAAQAAEEASAQLIKQCLDRLAQAGWSDGRDISVLESVSETTGFLRMRQEERKRFVEHEVWVAPIGVGFKTGRPIGGMLSGGWERIFHDSQLAIDRDGTIFHGAFSAEKQRRSWSKLDTPANKTQVEALAETLGAILAEYTVPSA
jgi:hypothetical protein